jgi:hypothetical protein
MSSSSSPCAPNGSSHAAATTQGSDRLNML